MEMLGVSVCLSRRMSDRFESGISCSFWGQAVSQSSAKALYVSSNLTKNSKKSKYEDPTFASWDDLYLYYPDFYLPDFDRYIEVKGYETDRDKTKYKAVNNLILLKANEINLIKKGLFKLDIGS